MRFIEKTSGTNSERDLGSKMKIKKTNLGDHVGIKFRIVCYSFFAH